MFRVPSVVISKVPVKLTGADIVRVLVDASIPEPDEPAVRETLPELLPLRVRAPETPDTAPDVI